MKIYLDDIRIPDDKDWILVTNYDEFVNKVLELGLKNIEIISLDHDLGDSAMAEYFRNSKPNGFINYDNITEKTGFDCAKWLVNHFLDAFPTISHPTMDDLFIPDPNADVYFPQIYTHSANTVGSVNITSFINNFLKSQNKTPTCLRVRIPHTNRDGIVF